MVFPLKVDGTAGLREMNSADIDYVVYLTMTGFAQRMLIAGEEASIFPGGAGTNIGSVQETISTPISNTQARNNSGAPDYPAAPGTIGSTTVTTTFRQNDNIAPYPSNAVADVDGYLIIDGTNGVRVQYDEADIITEIMQDCAIHMRENVSTPTGIKGIGTCRVSTGSPGADWTNARSWYVDRTFSAGNTDYRLWVKTSGTFTGASNLIHIDGTAGMKETPNPVNGTSGAYYNWLGVILQRYINNNGYLKYNVNTTGATTGVNRGTWGDTRQTGTTNVFTFSNPTYFATTNPAGAAVNLNNYEIGLVV